ncbi:hypothetical protein [Nocardia araoensis]|uniref:hypothetical protein n=1 Tax=Nocardia araoensis TaxID=228600 RepID=UPI0002DC869F|nr:hypothetical protein [Nocardia araoensis]
MVERRILPAAGLARLLGVLALLAGVVAMHTAVFGFSGHAHAAGAHGAFAPASEAVPDQLGRAVAGHATDSPHRHATPPPADAPTGDEQLRPRSGVHRDGGELTGDGRGFFGPASTPVIADGDSFTLRAVGTTTAGASSPPHSVVATRISHCSSGGCDGAHSALHGCVFILVAAIALAALVLLGRLAVDRPGGGAARPRHWRARRERPPPWTVLTLAELTILRI